MKTRFAKWLLLLSGIAVAIILLHVLGKREPEYEGKRLSTWFKQYYRTARTEDRHEEAARALRATGTNAVPFLLAEFYETRPDSAFKTNVYEALSRLPRPFRFPPFTPANSIRVEAANAIREIKLPDDFLVQLVTNRLHAADERQRLATIYLLCAVGCGADEVIPFLRNMLASTNGMEQLTGVIRLQQLGLLARPALPELIELVKSDQCDQRAVHAACRVLAEFGDQAADAAPAIKRRLENEARVSSRINFAKTLCRIDARQTNALAELIQYAADSTNALRGTAIMSLGDIGPNAKAAVPALVQAAGENDEQLWRRAAEALMKTGETNLAFSAMVKHLEDSDKRIRLNTAMLIVYYEPTDGQAISNLVEFTKDSAFGRTAIQQLGKLRPAPESAISALRELATNNAGAFRADAEKALRSIQAAEASQRQTR